MPRILKLEDVSRSYRMRKEEIASGKRKVQSVREMMKLKNFLNNRMQIVAGKVSLMEQQKCSSGETKMTIP